MTNENKIEWIKNDLADEGFGYDEMEAVEGLINYHSENFSYNEIEKEELELDSFEVLYSYFFGHFPDYDGDNDEESDEEEENKNEYDMDNGGNYEIYYEGKPYDTQEFRVRYTEGVLDSNNILGMLDKCNNYLQISNVSSAVGYGITYDNMCDLCAGYIYGTPELRKRILDFLTDINYHHEYAMLVDETDKFIMEVLDENSEYVKETWG